MVKIDALNNSAKYEPKLYHQTSRTASSFVRCFPLQSRAAELDNATYQQACALGLILILEIRR